jgi:methylase of polypeptide subunit release factors
MNCKIRDIEITLKPESNELIPCYNWFIGVLSNNTWETKTFEIFDECSDAKATALDIGSWIGATSIFLSKKFKNVIAVEADKNAIVALEKNIIDNNCSNIKVLEAAVYNDSLNTIFFGKNKTFCLSFINFFFVSFSKIESSS